LQQRRSASSSTRRSTTHPAAGQQSGFFIGGLNHVDSDDDVFFDDAFIAAGFGSHGNSSERYAAALICSPAGELTAQLDEICDSTTDTRHA